VTGPKIGDYMYSIFLTLVNEDLPADTRLVFDYSERSLKVKSDLPHKLTAGHTTTLYYTAGAATNFMVQPDSSMINLVDGSYNRMALISLELAKVA